MVEIESQSSSVSNRINNVSNNFKNKTPINWENVTCYRSVADLPPEIKVLKTTNINGQFNLRFDHFLMKEKIKYKINKVVKSFKSSVKNFCSSLFCKTGNKIKQTVNNIKNKIDNIIANISDPNEYFLNETIQINGQNIIKRKKISKTEYEAMIRKTD